MDNGQDTVDIGIAAVRMGITPGGSTKTDKAGNLRIVRGIPPARPLGIPAPPAAAERFPDS